MNKCFYVYSVKYWNETFQGEETRTGIVCGKNYTSAVKKVVEDYGEEYVLSITITEITADNTLELDEDVVADILEGGYR